MTAVVVVCAFVLMEPLTAVVHRVVMHGVGLAWHRSHHRRWFRPRGPGESFFERNDWFPVVFAGLTVLVVAAGYNLGAESLLVPAAAGATLYGLAYAFVHEIYIHQRMAFRWRHPLLDRLAAAHALHHRTGGEPYGMLFPQTSAATRRAQRVAATPGA